MLHSDPNFSRRTSGIRLIVCLVLAAIATPLAAIVFSVAVSRALGGMFAFRPEPAGYDYTLFLGAYAVSSLFMIVPASVALVWMKKNDLLGAGALFLLSFAMSFAAGMCMLALYAGAVSVPVLVLAMADGIISYGLVMSLMLTILVTARPFASDALRQATDYGLMSKAIGFGILALLAWAVTFSFLVQALDEPEAAAWPSAVPDLAAAPAWRPGRDVL
jgi:hypothetical protein